ncbi:MAG: CcmD family protein [Candidatus Dadabacteria bacterium]|nr:MAG: CcmD family protein [Candidatus Dadabacteria bacterium]
MKHLFYLGGAYAAVWILLFFYAWRLTSRSNELVRRLEELERMAARRGGN